MILRGLREVEGVEALVDIFDITEFTYTGKDMGERAITATIYHPSPIDFRVGDYVEFQMQSLNRAPGGMNGDFIFEKFYIYTMPTVKKTARPMTHGTAFEHTLTLYPAQYELGLVQMRDMGNKTNPDSIIYTGFDVVTFYGGARELISRIMDVLDEAYGVGVWSYEIANEVDEEINKALERYLFSFSGNTVMEALLKLNDKEGINTTFFINDRTIYVGFKRPYFCRVIDNGDVDIDISTQMFNMRYGKTSHENIAIDYGCLFDITKSIGKETPITKLFAYGASRNLNRFYCSDRIKTGRYVNRLMLPSFDADGKTDFILSENGIEKFGIREGSKQFEDIYPSLRYVNYGDIRQIQYCIKLKVSGLDGETKDNASFPIARVQCYKVVPSTVNVGVNALVECAPLEDIAVYIHTIDSVVKVVLYGGSTDAEAIAKQRAHDTIVPTRTKGGTDYIPGSCFAVHDRGFDDAGTTYENANRSAWFTNPNDLETSTLTDEQKSEIQHNQVTYSNTPFISDLYRFVNYNQTYFSRDGYSAWGWARLNSNYISGGGEVAHDTLLVNEVVAVEPVVIPDTDLNIAGLAPRQQTFDIYLRDLGFKLDEQNDFGEMVFVLNGEVKVSFIDGTLGGREFNVAGKVTDFQENCICAFNDDATINDEFFKSSGYTDRSIADKAFADGAIWRLRLIRSNLDEPNLSNLAIALPTPELNAKQGDHIVLLDLFMPDVYIHAAENRLLREAQQYLNANDKGSVSYAVNFDEVRMQQIPNYALQIREGLKVRMVDDDLGIVTENSSIKLFDGELISNTSMMETTYDCTPSKSYYYEITTRDCSYLEHELMDFDIIVEGKSYSLDTPSRISYSGTTDGNFSGTFSARVIDSDYNMCNESGGYKEFFAKDNKLKMRIYKNRKWVNERGQTVEIHLPTDIYITLNVSSLTVLEISRNSYAIEGSYSTYLDKQLLSQEFVSVGSIRGVIEYDIRERVDYEYDVYTPNTHLLPMGAHAYAPSKVLIKFSNNKHYEVKIEAHNINMLYLDSSSNPLFVLLNNFNKDIYYQPDCTITQNVIGSDIIEYTISFDLDVFNDSIDYYPALLYISDNATQFVTTKLISITESYYEGVGVLKYADFVLDTVTINVSDNSNRDVGSAPIKKISATLSEQQDASAWATLMNKVEETAIEGEANAAAVENLVNSARKNYLSILSLKNSIFDPDGSCNQTFLQVMMLQIGADSMNYQLDKTKVSVNGTRYNCFCGPDKTDGNKPHFKVYSNDILRHFVYSSGAGGHSWTIPYGIDVTLDGKSTYFVAIKCQTNGTVGEWVCDTIQHKVNESSTYWYFNWGILTCDGAGVYTLIETRGNAYMYGDNLICGKISDLAKKSWFDLTKGEFVLGDNGDGTASLKYVNGVLTIGGLPNESEVAKMLAEFDSRLSNIGGGNLLKQSSFHKKYTTGEYAAFTKLYSLEAGKTYIATCGKFVNNAGGAINEPFNEICLTIGFGSFLYTEDIVRFGEPFTVSGNGRSLYLTWCLDAYALSMKGQDDYSGWEVATDFTQYVDQVMLQEGSVATGFQPSIEAVANQTIGGENYATFPKGEYHYNTGVSETENYTETIIITEYYYDDEDNIVYKYLPSGDYVFSCNVDITPIISEDTSTIDVYLQTIRKDGVITNSIRLPNFATTENLVITIDSESYFVISVNAIGLSENSGLDINFTKVMLQRGVKSTSFVDYVNHLTTAFKNDTEIAGGVVSTSLINLRGDDGNIIAGVSGLKDQSETNHGVTLWSGGTYLDALSQADEENQLNSLLPILLTKTGVKSKIGCFEVVSRDEIAIYKEDRTSRILLSAIGDNNSSIRLQMLSNGEFVDKVIISDESIDANIISKTYTSSIIANIIKKQNVVLDLSNIRMGTLIGLEGDKWRTNMNSKHKVIFELNTQFKNNAAMRFGKNSVLIFYKTIGGNTDIVIWEKDITNFYATSITDSCIKFEIPLKSTSMELSAGYYSFKIIATNVIRTGKAGADHTEPLTCDEITKGTVTFKLAQPIHFTRVADGDSGITRIGRDGIKISVSSSSNFIVKNTGSKLTVMANGLPNAASETPGTLYVDGNTLKIS